MVQITRAALLSVLAAVAAAEQGRLRHANLHQRGEYPTKPANTYPVSTPAEHQTYPVSTPAEHKTYPVSTPEEHKTYPVSTPKEHTTYPVSTPEASETTCTEEETTPVYTSTKEHKTTYPVSSPVASYPVSSPVASYPVSSPVASYPVSTPVASYPASTPVASYPVSTPEASYPVSTPEASYPVSTPEASYPAESTSTSYVVIHSTYVSTVTGAYPTAPAVTTGGVCGTVTVTVYGSQPVAETSEAPSTYEVSTYEAPSSTYEAPSTYEVSTPSSYAVSTPAAHTYPAVNKAYETPAAKPNSYSGGKRGVAFQSIPALQVAQATNCHWAWNWGAAAASALPSSVEFVPMMKSKDDASEFHNNAGSSKYVMSFNEPDMTTGGGGTAMSPQDAAQAYHENMKQYYGSKQVGCPAVTSHDSATEMLNGVSQGSGLSWLKAFAQSCKSLGCQVDFVPLHWYGNQGDSAESQAAAFKQYVQQGVQTAHELFGPNTKVWFTEFSALPKLDSDTQGINSAFMKDVLPYLESNPDVARYSYFAALPSMLVNADGSWTEAGKTYAGA